MKSNRQPSVAVKSRLRGASAGEPGDDCGTHAVRI